MINTGQAEFKSHKPLTLHNKIGIGDLRLGTSIAWFHEDAIQVSGTNPSTGEIQRYATGALAASRPTRHFQNLFLFQFRKDGRDSIHLFIL